MRRLSAPETTQSGRTLLPTIGNISQIITLKSVSNLITAFGVLLSLWSVLIGIWHGDVQQILLSAMAITFLAAAAGFLADYAKTDECWFSAPVFMTFMAMSFFVIVPQILFLSGSEQIDSEYVFSMFLVLIGFLAFWCGVLMFKRNAKVYFVADTRESSIRVKLMALVLFSLGAIAKFVLWKLGLIGYAMATLSYDSPIAQAQLLVGAGRMLDISFLIAGIEVIGKGSTSQLLRSIMFAAFSLSLGFGIVSGMKLEILMPILLLIILMGITQRRLPVATWVAPLVLVLASPFVTAYRANLNSGYIHRINTVNGLVEVIGKSVEDTFNGQADSGGGQGQSSDMHRYGSRYSDLGAVRDVVQLPNTAVLEGDESIWMAPIYPFIPRIFWPGKPILNKGQRMSAALGIGAVSSTNIPAIGDFYAINGIPAVLAGMLIWGALLQLYMNLMGGGLTPKGLFFYIVMLDPITPIEKDVVLTIGFAVQIFLITLMVAQVVYGGRLFTFHAISDSRDARRVAA